MRVLQVHNNGPVANGVKPDGFPEVNQVLEDEKKEEVTNGVSGGRPGNSRRGSGDMVVTNGISGNTGLLHASNLRPHGQSVRWERFLPLKSLKILLVENDDSTRHVVSALLRNCSYEVTPVSNGLQAWKLLEDLNNQIDLVLTEIVMPGLSGIGLLYKIMNHKTCKNIPVIMMSSHDSMAVVFNCLSKGAADFLVKPLRKNELKNLWQHIWRKCHNSSGSGSESGIRAQNSSTSRSDEESDNEVASGEYDDRSTGRFVRYGSDNGSGTQSTWVTKTVEVDSPRTISRWEQLSDPQDTTCAQVIRSKSEAYASSWVPMPEEEHKANVSVTKDAHTGLPGNPGALLEETRIKRSADVNVIEKELSAALDSKPDVQVYVKASNQIRSDKSEMDEVADLSEIVGIKCDTQRKVIIESKCDPQIGIIIGSVVPCDLSESPKSKDDCADKTKELLSLELTLKRTGDDNDIRPANQDKNTLRHSELSAFTKYQAGSTANSAQTESVGRCAPHDNSSGAAKTVSAPNPPLNSCGTLPNQGSNNSSNNNDMGSTTYQSFTKAITEEIDKPAAKATACLVDATNTSTFMPIDGGLESGSQSVLCNKSNVSAVNGIHVQVKKTDKDVQVQHHHHHYHHHHYHHHHQQQQQKNMDDSPQDDLVVEPLQCGSSNEERNNSVEVKNAAGNFCVNGSSVSGSNHGSNYLNNGNVTPLNAERTTNVMINVKGEACDGSRNGSGTTGADQCRSAQREAALNKFRQKRKERCFEKKVRYMSRKKLAEQRPRIRGQFVKQVQDVKSEDADS